MGKWYNGFILCHMTDAPESNNLKQAAIEAVLSSRILAKSPGLARLFQYICQKSLEGSAPDLKEYNIGIDALGRPADFDPAKSAIVRVEVHRLREKLKKYYQVEGKHDPLIISLPPGSYIPQFTPGVRMNQVGGGFEASPKRAANPISPETDAAAALTESEAANIEPVSRDAQHSSRLVSALKLRSRLYLAVIAGLVIILVMLATRKSGSLPEALSPGAPKRAEAAAPRIAENRADQPVRIIAGYNKAQYVDRAGHVWLGDRDFDGGSPGTQSQTYFARTLDPTLFRTMRLGDFSYNVPLHPGNYELRLYFAETTYGPDTLSGGGEGSRTFTVTANGKTILNGFDVLCDARGDDIGDVRVFKDITPGLDGYLHLAFKGSVSDPFIDAIAVTPAPQGKINPVRITAQEDSFTDHTGNFWSADRYFMGGRLVLRKLPVSNTPDPGLYNGERYGNFSYAIPVADGKYRLTLRFAETYFGPHNLGGGGAGSRLFNVNCNGVALLKNFDIYKQSGGENRALEETFTGLKPNAQGKLTLEFVPVVNYASINAIEVVDESR